MLHRGSERKEYHSLLRQAPRHLLWLVGHERQESDRAFVDLHGSGKRITLLDEILRDRYCVTVTDESIDVHKEIAVDIGLLETIPFSCPLLFIFIPCSTVKVEYGDLVTTACRAAGNSSNNP